MVNLRGSPVGTSLDTPPEEGTLDIGDEDRLYGFINTIYNIRMCIRLPSRSRFTLPSFL